MASDEPAIGVEVLWSPAPRELRRATLALPAGATVADALKAAGWDACAPAAQGDGALRAAGLASAVWGRLRPLATRLRDGDRVELLRALTIDPMSARRARYEAAGGQQALRRRRYEAQLKR